MKIKRPESITDSFCITCRKCGSTNVDLMVDSCETCGPTINAECNKCGNQYNYHNFKMIETEYK